MTALNNLRGVRYYIEDHLLPLFIIIFLLIDLWPELELLLDHFTFTSVIFAIRYKFLSIIFLVITPRLWCRFDHLGLRIWRK